MAYGLERLARPHDEDSYERWLGLFEMSRDRLESPPNEHGYVDTNSFRFVGEEFPDAPFVHYLTDGPDEAETLLRGVREGERMADRYRAADDPVDAIPAEEREAAIESVKDARDVLVDGIRA